MNQTRRMGDAVLIGSGPHKVAVLHGWLGGSASWSDLWPHLDGDGFAYAFVDFRGYGNRIYETGEFTMAEAAADTLAQIHHLGWREYCLVGHSMGGLAAQIVLADAPEAVRGLFGVSPVPACASPLGEREQNFRNAVRDATAREALLAASTGNRHGHQWYAEMTANSLNTTSAAALDTYLTSWTSDDISERVTGMTTPIALAVGEHDPAYPQERMQRTWGRYYPQYELHRITDSGHYPMNENPVELADQMENFLSRCTLTDPKLCHQAQFWDGRSSFPSPCAPRSRWTLTTRSIGEPPLRRRD